MIFCFHMVFLFALYLFPCTPLSLSVEAALREVLGLGLLPIIAPADSSRIKILPGLIG